MCIYICTCIFVCMHTHIWMFMFHITYFWSGLQFCETAATFAIRVLQRFSIGFQQKALLEASIRCLNSISSCPHISQRINHRGGFFQILSKPVKPCPSPSGDAVKGPGLQEYAAEGAQLLSFPHCPWAAQIRQGPWAGMRSRAVKGAAEGRVMPPGVSQPGGNREGRVGEGSREALWFKYAVARARAIWKPNLNICLQNQVMTGPLLSQGGQENGPCTCHLIQFKTWHIYQEWAGIMNFIHAVSGVNNLSPTAFVSLAAVPLIGLRYLFK